MLRFVSGTYRFLNFLKKMIAKKFWNEDPIFFSKIGRFFENSRNVFIAELGR